MLPSGLQMLPLLWLLLWTPKPGLSSPLRPGGILTNEVREYIPSLYNRTCDGVIRRSIEKDPETNGDLSEDVVTLVKMTHNNDEIYQQFRKRQHNVYMVFNKTKLREAVPETSFLCLAELHLHRHKQNRKQLVMLFERYSNNSWHYLSLQLPTPNNTTNWLQFNVTEVVRRWLNQEGPIEIFRLSAVSLGEKEENVLHKDISGFTPKDPGDHPENDNRSRPFLFLLTSRLKQAQL